MAAIELYEAMRTLRAVRRLRPDPIPDDVLRRVLEAAVTRRVANLRKSSVRTAPSIRMRCFPAKSTQLLTI